ncbi:MAG: hypothetical protein ACRDA5_13750 [Clostridium sp.]
MGKCLKKKQGNSLLIVLIISMVLVVVGGVVVSAVMNTTNADAYSKTKDDLFYAAESGIQKGVAKLQNGYSAANTTAVDIGVREFETSYNIYVNTTIERLDITKPEYKIVSIATKNGQNRKITSIINKELTLVPGAGRSLLQYSLAGTNVNVYSTGSLDAAVTKVLSTNIPALTAPTATSGSVDRNGFLVPVFDTTKVKQGNNVSVKSIGNDADVLGELYIKSTDLNSGIKYEKIIIEGSTPGSVKGKINVFYVNVKELVIYNTNVTLNDTIIISSGKIYIAGQDLSDDDKKIFEDKSKFSDWTNFPKTSTTDHMKTSTLTLSNGNIIANEVNLCTDSVSLYYPPLGVVGDPNIAHSYIDPIKDKAKVDNIIKDKISNWTTGGTGTIENTYIEGDLTVENNY